MGEATQRAWWGKRSIERKVQEGKHNMEAARGYHKKATMSVGGREVHKGDSWKNMHSHRGLN